MLLLRFVISPLNRMNRTMTSIANGDYARPVPYAGRHDEIGEMAEALMTFKGVSPQGFTAAKCFDQRS